MINFPKLFTEMGKVAGPLLSQKCNLIRVTETKGSTGGNTVSESTVLTGVPCLFAPASSRERLIASQMQSSLDGTVYLPGIHNGVRLDIQGTDKIIVQTSEAQATRTYNVTGAPRNHQGIIIEAPVAFAE